MSVGVWQTRAGHAGLQPLGQNPMSGLPLRVSTAHATPGGCVELSIRELNLLRSIVLRASWAPKAEGSGLSDCVWMCLDCTAKIYISLQNQITQHVASYVPSMHRRARVAHAGYSTFLRVALQHSI